MNACLKLCAVCFCALATLAGEAAEPVRPPIGSPPRVVGVPDEYRPWGWKRPLFPDPLFDLPELAPLAIDRQNQPEQDVSLNLSAAVTTALRHSDVVRVLEGGTVVVDPATQYDPVVRAAQRDAAFTVFDPTLSAGYIGSQINEPPSSFFGPGIEQQTRRDEGDFTASLGKLWQTGATTRLAYDPPLGYLFFPQGSSGSFNPIYTSAFVLEARQPLWRGAGLTVNQAPLRIAQLRQEQSQWEFKQAVQAQIRSIEEAYWELQAAYIQLQTMDAVIPFAEEALRLEEARLQLELTIRADVARAQVQLTQFRQQRIELEANAKEREYRLRNLMGLPAVDGTRLVPIDPPVPAPPKIHADAAVDVAVQNRPDIVQRRLSLRIRELEYFMATNGLKPQLDLQALYRANGVGQGVDDALRQAGLQDFTDWTLGLTFSVPLGNRAAKANLRAAEAQLSRERAVLRETVRNVGYRIADLVRDLRSTWDQYQLARQRVEASQEWLMSARIRFTTPPPTSQSQDSLLLLLSDYQTALRANLDAVTDASQLIARYNGLLARFEEAQGTLLISRGIELADDPVCAVNRHQVPLYAATSGTSKAPASATMTPRGTPSNTGVQPAGWTQPARLPPGGSIDPVGDYRTPESFVRSPFQGGWSQPPPVNAPVPSVVPAATPTIRSGRYGTVPVNLPPELRP
ncbi:MAG TPA: TolC family protein [Planctomycetaceae bacterium]|nr:TolC family protein [Planctomycetaceae bacterium]